MPDGPNAPHDPPGETLCPRCSAPRRPADLACPECRWIFLDPGFARGEVSGYPGETVWRGFSWLMQASGVALLFWAFQPGRIVGPGTGSRGPGGSLAIVVLVLLIAGWGLRRKGPSGSVLAALGWIALLAATASLRQGFGGALVAVTLTAIPFALVAFPSEIGEAMAYIPIKGTPPGGAIAGTVLTFLGWGLLALASLAVLRSV